LILYISITSLKPSLIKLLDLNLGMGVLGLLGYLLIAPFAKDGRVQEEYSHI
jgi:hypothetical protein